MSADLSGLLTLLFGLLSLGSNAVNAVLVYTRPNRLGDERLTALLESPRMYAALHTAHIVWLAALFAAFVQWTRSLEALSLGQRVGVWLVGGLVWVLLDFSLGSFFARNAEQHARRLYWAARLLALPFMPFGWLIVKLLPSDTLPTFQAVMTEADLKEWVENDLEASALQPEERRMIYSIFQFGETLAREIMVPRIDVTALDVDTSVDEAVRTFVESGHSRLPVFSETIDNVLGLLYAKDLLPVLQGGKTDLDLRSLLRPPYFIPETKKVDDVLAEMQSQRIHMAIVVDEYGGFAGLVTLEDIVEEIVGEILDEYDQSEEALYAAVGPDEFLFAGRIDIDDFNEVMQANLHDEEAETLAGFVYDQLGRVPEEGVTLQVDDLLFTVEQVSGRRIRRIRVRRQPVAEKDESHDVVS